MGVRKVRKKPIREGEKSDLIEVSAENHLEKETQAHIRISCEPKLDRAQVILSPGNQLWGRTIINSIMLEML